MGLEMVGIWGDSCGGWFIRELFGTGNHGNKSIPQQLYDWGYVDVGLMVYAPAAFIVIGLITWVQNEWIERAKHK